MVSTSAFPLVSTRIHHDFFLGGLTSGIKHGLLKNLVPGTRLQLEGRPYSWGPMGGFFVYA